MVSNRITEGVGKKIVDALKQQADIEIQNVVENPVEDFEPRVDEIEENFDLSKKIKSHISTGLFPVI